MTKGIMDACIFFLCANAHLVFVSGVEGDLTDLGVPLPECLNRAHFQLKAFEES